MLSTSPPHLSPSISPVAVASAFPSIRPANETASRTKVKHLQTYPLRRIDASRLFYPADQKITTTPPQVEDDRLREPFISFSASPTAEYGSRVLDFFAMFGRGENKSLIAGADENGLTVMYDLAQRTVHNQLRLNSPKHIIDAVSLAVGDSLYVIDRTPALSSCHGSFEALVYDGEQYSKHDESIW
ncbi:hypothetical protein HU200_001857 [Digitaria exilis]|uniref:Uncharacterized protein n=1 Tax=Digitaria exilis TaxID=1010633 RepID=A0A835KVN0_9POAL|nr:hypothetical protein HU200_001857 [Digitaria exilis]